MYRTPRTDCKWLSFLPGTSLALDFVADFVVSGRAAVEPEVAVCVLEHLSAAPDQAEAEGPLDGSGGAEREDRFVAVLMSSGLAATGGTTPAWVTRDILRFAKSAGFLQAEAQVHPSLSCQLLLTFEGFPGTGEFCRVAGSHSLIRLRVDGTGRSSTNFQPLQIICRV